MSDNPHLSQDHKTMAMLCHLAGFAGLIIPGLGSLLGPLLLWQLKKNDSPFIDFHGKEAVNFQITMFIAFSISAMLMIILIGFFMLIGLGIMWLVLVIMASIKAADGEYYRYPFCLRLIR